MTNKMIELSLSLIRLNYGRKVTLDKCKEELQELIDAINKNDFENVHEEVADVYNILSHIKAYYNISDEEINKRQEYKVKREVKRIKEYKAKEWKYR